RCDLLRDADDLAGPVLYDEDDPAPVGDHQIARAHGDVPDPDRLVERLLDDPTPGRHRRAGQGVDRQANVAALVDVAAGAIHDHTGHAFHFGRQREDAAPAGRL